MWREAGSVLALALAVLSGCGDGKAVTLGRNPSARTPEARPRFEVVRRLEELVSGDKKNDNPTLTADMLSIYFTTERNEDESDVDVWFAERSDASEPFGAPEPVDAVNSDERETSSAVSLDGDELWFATEGDVGVGELDIWVARRASKSEPWGEPAHVPELNTSKDDIPRPPGFGDRVMPVGSRVLGDGLYATFLATRPTPEAPFGAPQPIDELLFPEVSTIDAFLSEDGLSLFFNMTPGAGETEGDLYVARRATAGEPFGDPEPLEELNTPGDERDPWLSPDGRHLFYASSWDGESADGTLNIFEARLIEP